MILFITIILKDTKWEHNLWCGRTDLKWTGQPGRTGPVRAKRNVIESCPNNLAALELGAILFQIIMRALRWLKRGRLRFFDKSAFECGRTNEWSKICDSCISSFFYLTTRRALISQLSPCQRNQQGTRKLSWFGVIFQLLEEALGKPPAANKFEPREYLYQRADGIQGRQCNQKRLKSYPRAARHGGSD